MPALERWPWLSSDPEVRSVVIAGTGVPLARLRDHRRTGQDLAALMDQFPILREHSDAARAAWSMSDQELDVAIAIAPAIEAWVAQINRKFDAMQAPGSVEAVLEGWKPPLTAHLEASEAEPGQDERQNVVWCVEEPVGPRNWDRWSTCAMCWRREEAERIAAGIEGSRITDWRVRP